MRRSSWASWLDVGRSGSAMVLVGVLGCIRGRMREREIEEGDGRGKSREGARGLRGVVWGRPGRRQKQEVAGAGRSRASVLLAREEDDREEAVVG